MTLTRSKNLAATLLFGAVLVAHARSIAQSSYDCSAQSDIPTMDCEALVALYDSTNGDNWDNKSQWLSGSPCSWFGIVCIVYPLYDVQLAYNSLRGRVPAAIGNLSGVIRLTLSGNYLEGRIPPELGELSNLIGLFMENNQLAGPIPPELGGLANLRLLYLNQNQLTGPLPSELGDLANVEEVDIGYNLLSGAIPEDWGNLSSLVYLFLSSNDLSGPIPASFGNLGLLRKLILDENELSGPIPASISNLSDLRDLDVSGNQLTGPVPPWLGNLSKLISLDLSRNSLSGDIPPSLGRLDGLVSMRLDRNNLGGTLPLPVATVGSNADTCNLTANSGGICIPNIPAYQALAFAGRICGVPLSALCEPVIHADVRVFLEGPYVAGSMSADANFTSLIPVDQPYQADEFNGTPLDHDNPDQVPIPPDSVQDWVLVSLRSAPSSLDEVSGSRRAAFVLSNGMVVDTAGGSLAFPGVHPGSYYLVVGHRNHAGVMTSDTLDLSDGFAEWDFTNQISRAYSTGPIPMKAFGDGRFAMFACDIDANGFVTVGDFNLWNRATSVGLAGYVGADCSMDAHVTASDFNLWNSNSTAGAASSVPN